jgi:hypothetical protein
VRGVSERGLAAGKKFVRAWRNSANVRFEPGAELWDRGDGNGILLPGGFGAKKERTKVEGKVEETDIEVRVQLFFNPIETGGQALGSELEDRVSMTSKSIIKKDVAPITLCLSTTSTEPPVRSGKSWKAEEARGLTVEIQCRV